MRRSVTAYANPVVVSYIHTIPQGTQGCCYTRVLGTHTVLVHTHGFWYIHSFWHTQLLVHTDISTHKEEVRGGGGDCEHILNLRLRTLTHFTITNT